MALACSAISIHPMLFFSPTIRSALAIFSYVSYDSLLPYDNYPQSIDLLLKKVRRCMGLLFSIKTCKEREALQFLIRSNLLLSDDRLHYDTLSTYEMPMIL